MITPCVSICSIDAQTQVCIGCGRTRSEIENWSKMNEKDQYEIMKRLGYGRRMGRQEKLRRYDHG